MQFGRNLLRYTIAGGVFGIVVLGVFFSLALAWDQEESVNDSRKIQRVSIVFDQPARLVGTPKKEPTEWRFDRTPSVFIADSFSLKSGLRLDRALGTEIVRRIGPLLNVYPAADDDAKRTIERLILRNSSRSSCRFITTSHGAKPTVYRSRKEQKRFENGLWMAAVISHAMNPYNHSRQASEERIAAESLDQQPWTTRATPAAFTCTLAWESKNESYVANVLAVTNSNLPYAALILFFIGFFINASYYKRYRPRDNTGQLMLCHYLIPRYRWFHLRMRPRDRGGFILSRLFGDGDGHPANTHRSEVRHRVLRSLTNEDVESFSFGPNVIICAIETFTLCMYMAVVPKNVLKAERPNTKRIREQWLRFTFMVLRWVLVLALIVLTFAGIILVMTDFAPDVFSDPLIDLRYELDEFGSGFAPFGWHLLDWTSASATCLGLLKAVGMVTLLFGSLALRGWWRSRDVRFGSVSNDEKMRESVRARDRNGNPASRIDRSQLISAAVRNPSGSSKVRWRRRDVASDYIRLSGRLGLVPTLQLLFVSTTPKSRIGEKIIVDGRTWDGTKPAWLMFEMSNRMEYEQMCDNLDDSTRNSLQDARKAAIKNRYSYLWNQRQWRLEWEHRFYLMQSMFDSSTNGEIKLEYVHRSERYHSAGVAREAIPWAFSIAVFAWCADHLRQVSEHLGVTCVVAIGIGAVLVAVFMLLHNVRRIYWYALVKLTYNDINESVV